jgi:hypothetical protein
LVVLTSEAFRCQWNNVRRWWTCLKHWSRDYSVNSVMKKSLFPGFQKGQFDPIFRWCFRPHTQVKPWEWRGCRNRSACRWRKQVWIRWSAAQPHLIDFVNKDDERPIVTLAIRMLRVQTEFMGISGDRWPSGGRIRHDAKPSHRLSLHQPWRRRTQTPSKIDPKVQFPYRPRYLWSKNRFHRTPKCIVVVSHNYYRYFFRRLLTIKWMGSCENEYDSDITVYTLDADKWNIATHRASPLIFYFLPPAPN